MMRRPPSPPLFPSTPLFRPPGGTPQPGRAKHPPADPNHDEHGEGTGDRRRDPPAELVLAEDPLPEPGQPLAQRRVHHQRAGGVCVVPLPPPGGEILSLDRVVDLVEDRMGERRGGEEGRSRGGPYHYK